KPGEAVITGAYNLPNKKVIHCLGPVYGQDTPEDKLLANCYRNALKIAEEEKIQSVAFPSISTGAFGYPLEDAAGVAMKTIKEMLKQLQNVKLIRMVLFSKKDLEVYENKLNENF
ncbi:MAG: macro domain-containing protein, partial [Prolixibacteraceae bacterium]